MLNIFKKIAKIKSCKRKQARRKIVLASLFTGSVTALLTFFSSKKTGEQNRKMVINKAQSASKTIARVTGKTATQIRDKAEELGERTKETASDLRDKFGNKTTEIRKEIGNVAHNIGNRIEVASDNIEEDARKNVANAAHKVGNAADKVEQKSQQK